MTSKKERTREHILECSYSLFAQRGFNNVTMKDICDITGLSRGGLYSHFSSTGELFEALLEKMNAKTVMNFHEEIEKGVSARVILEGALELMEEEMNHPEDSMSLAMYEYAASEQNGRMDHFNQIGEEKWTALIEYGISTGEFHKVNVKEIVDVILYAYQGIRMWSRIVAMTQATVDSIISHIRSQLIKE